jgi:hypothetical protein
MESSRGGWTGRTEVECDEAQAAAPNRKSRGIRTRAARVVERLRVVAIVIPA